MPIRSENLLSLGGIVGVAACLSGITTAQARNLACASLVGLQGFHPPYAFVEATTALSEVIPMTNTIPTGRPGVIDQTPICPCRDNIIRSG